MVCAVEEQPLESSRAPLLLLPQEIMAMVMESLDYKDLENLYRSSATVEVHFSSAAPFRVRAFMFLRERGMTRYLENYDKFDDIKGWSEAYRNLVRNYTELQIISFGADDSALIG